MRSVEAQSAAGALAQVAARGNALHSGVALDLGVLDAGDTYGNVYAYTDRSGMKRNVIAATYDAARILAADRAGGSELMLLGSVTQ